MRRPWAIVLLSLVCAACNTVPTSSSPVGASINVGQPEVFENADLQAQLDALRAQLASLNVIDKASLVNALGNLQGASATQSGVSFQLLQRALPQVATTASATPSTTVTEASLTPTVPPSTVPTPPTLPNVALGSIGVLDQQLQLTSQVLGYELLLTGSDFARYTTHGGAKDKLVIGFPITLNPRQEDKDQAAEVEITYFPPNSNQFINPIEFANHGLEDFDTQSVCDPNGFSDKNAPVACLQEESSPTIVNILPTERSYNTVVLSASSNTFGLGAIIGTVGVGLSAGRGSQTQYLVAQQDTIALQGNGPRKCSSEADAATQSGTKADGPPQSGTASASSAKSLTCVEGSRGVTFAWQFRPVLGAHFVRAGLRRMYVQLAIPYARRPYPNYGGLVEIRTHWRPFNTKVGVPADDVPSTREPPDTRAVFGHPFIGPTLSELTVYDLGGGNVLVTLKGSYLIGASVLVGSTSLTPSSPGFVASYNSLQFVTTAQALAQSGAVVVASGGVVTPVTANSFCKTLDPLGECFRLRSDSEEARFQVKRVEVEPVTDSTSLVRVKLAAPTGLPTYAYHHYFRIGKDVVGGSDDRKPETAPQRLSPKQSEELSRFPIVVTAGGKTYGFSDLPFQDMSREASGLASISFVVSNDSLSTSPEIKVKRLFGDPASDSLAVELVPPGRLQLTPLNHDVVTANGAVKEMEKPDPKQVVPEKSKVTNKSDTRTQRSDIGQAPKTSSKTVAQSNCYPTLKLCEYILVGAMADQVRLYDDDNDTARHRSASCSGRIELSEPRALGYNARKLRIPSCYKQVVLEFHTNKSSSNEIAEVIALPLVTSSSTAGAKSVADTTIQTPNAPNFSLIRAVQNVTETSGVAYITVGIQKLKDQNATLAVSNADVVTATDGNGGLLSVQAGNQVTITQDTNITFQLRNASPSSVNVTAEGKNGTTSTGKVSFTTAFNISHQDGGGKSK